MISVIFAVNSCKKADQEQPADIDQTISYAKMIHDRINSFRAQMKGTYKSGELISLDSAIWNLEALITYDQAYPDSVSKDFIIKKSFFTLPVDQNHMVDENDVQALYYDMLDTIDDQLSNFNVEMKFLAFSDVELVQIDNENAIIKANNGYGFNYLLNMYYPFEEDDDWIWGSLNEEYYPPAGKCDGTEIGVSDGSDELQFRLNNPIAQSPYSSFTDLETFLIDGLDFLDNEGNPRLFVGYYVPSDYCLTDDVLTYYLIQSDEIINTPVSEGGLKPQGKVFVDVYILDTFTVGTGIYAHFYYVTYGVPAPDYPD